MRKRDRSGELYGLLAEFDDTESLTTAATRLTIHGYRRVGIYTPFPVREVKGLFASWRTDIANALIAPAVFLGGASGAAIAFGMLEYINLQSYPINTGGYPYNSWPSFVPITFEIAILGAALAAVAIFLIVTQLPRPHHPLFNEPRFERATQDRFFICAEKQDRKFDSEKTRDLLESLGAIAVVEVRW